MNVLMIGRSDSLCKEIQLYGKEHGVYILEEENINKKNNNQIHNNVKDIYEAEYIQSNEFMQIIERLNKSVEFDLVIPAFEYSVVPANLIAKFLNLPRIGDTGATIFTDKIELRKFCLATNIPCPKFSEIFEVSDLIKFYDNNPIVFKPANRHGSLGVKMINNRKEIEKVFNYTTTANEKKHVPERNLKWRYIAEEMVYGNEYSVEVFVQKGKILFVNFTNKRKYNNEFFVESGHRIPSDLTKNQMDDLRRYMEIIVEEAHVQDAILHAEWIINDTKKYIIECAGRRPGDNIPELISRSYGKSFYSAYFEILAGIEINFPQNPSKYVGIQYFVAKEGFLKEISGLDILDRNDLGIIHWEINKREGEYIPLAKNSWDRIGYFIVESENEVELNRVIDEIESKVCFNTI